MIRNHLRGWAVMKRIWIRGFIIGRRLAVNQGGAKELGVCGGYDGAS